MTLPTQHQDVWAKATQQDIVVALSRLSSLPARQIEAGTEAIARDAMYRGLAGVTKHGINEAINAVLQNKLGHAFFPSPPELRMLHDRAMEHHVSMRNRIARQERIAADRPPSLPQRSPEEMERHRKRMAEFHSAMPKADPRPEFDWSKVHERFDAKKPDSVKE